MSPPVLDHLVFRRQDDAMRWSTDEAYLHGLDFFDSVVDRALADSWYRPTPCGAWRAVDVLGHVGAATRFGTELLSGASPTWSPTDEPGEAVAEDRCGHLRVDPVGVAHRLRLRPGSGGNDSHEAT